jgi:hypothetical protein
MQNSMGIGQQKDILKKLSKKKHADHGKSGKWPELKADKLKWVEMRVYLTHGSVLYIKKYTNMLQACNTLYKQVGICKELEGTHTYEHNS